MDIDDRAQQGPPKRSDAAARQIDTIIAGIVEKHPRLKSAREAVARKDEPSDKFAQEFLSVFRQRLQGDGG